MPKVNLVAVDNGAGLSRDIRIVASLLETHGFGVRLFPPGGVPAGAAADLNLFLEILDPAAMAEGRRNAMIPNPEWWRLEWAPWIPQLDVGAKTHSAVEPFSRARSTTYVGFTSYDQQDPTIARRRTFLHLAGRSSTKGTGAVLGAWESHPEWPTLVLVVHPTKKPKSVLPANVELHCNNVSGDKLRGLLNRCQFHLCPSECEGFGHHLNEGRSCGAVVLTTDAPPMNEMVSADSGVLISCQNKEQRRLVMGVKATVREVEEGVTRALGLSSEEIGEKSGLIRRDYLHGRREFFQKFPAWVKSLCA